ncbi:hypothetical protein [Tenacibaculum jejuense]|uniref:Uncharacterized protein n=1 Tax=Tenacibaculum jejuense TaxID=584609 RepID=A0A238UDZ4_9FLAO|nr:hypothetical protein [Tenacibaculum jejuense]SNR17275.1 Probable transmembrane protein of unknown function [Tenacibaculum jejuense]
MFQSFIIVAVLCVGSFFYYKYMMQKTKAVAADFDENEVKNNLQKYMDILTENQLDYLKVWLKDKPIHSFTDASIAISTKDKAKNAAVDAAKSVAWAVVGVKAKYRRVETAAHLVFSDNELHFLAANVDGDLETHITFTETQLANAKIEYKGPKKGVDLASGVTDFISAKLNKEENMINVFAITFKDRKDNLIIQAHDKVMLPYEMGDSSYTKNTMIANVISKSFFQTLGEKYPNLTASKVKMVS